MFSNWLHHTAIISTLRLKAVFKRCVLGVQGGRGGSGEGKGKGRKEEGMGGKVNKISDHFIVTCFC